MKNCKFELTNGILANINYWLHIVENAKEGGDIYQKGLGVDESNIAKAFQAGIKLRQSFGLSIDLINQISQPLASGPRIDEWITLISMAITNIPREYEKRLCVLHNLLGLLYIGTNRPFQAFNAYQQAHSLASVEHNIRELGIAKLGIARYFLQNKQYDLAKDYARGVIREMEGKKSLKGIFAAGWNMLGVISVNQNNFLEAKRLFKLVIKMYRAQTKDAQYAVTLGNLAIVFSQEEKYLQSLRYLARCRRILLNQHSPSHVRQIDYLFGLTFMKLEWWDKAEKSFIRAIASSLANIPDLSFLCHLYECLGAVCQKNRNIELATHYLKKSIQLSSDGLA